MTDLSELRDLLEKVKPIRAYQRGDHNSAFLVAAVDSLPDLLDEVEKLRAENRALLEVAEAARLKRNVFFTGSGNQKLKGDWVAIPREDFNALRSRVNRLDSPNVKEGGK